MPSLDRRDRRFLSGVIALNRCLERHFWYVCRETLGVGPGPADSPVVVFDFPLSEQSCHLLLVPSFNHPFPLPSQNPPEPGWTAQEGCSPAGILPHCPLNYITDFSYFSLSCLQRRRNCPPCTSSITLPYSPTSWSCLPEEEPGLLLLVPSMQMIWSMDQLQPWLTMQSTYSFQAWSESPGLYGPASPEWECIRNR